MTIQEANEIITKEHLEDYVCFDERERNKADKAVLCNRYGIWVTYLCDERGGMFVGSLRKHDALDDALKRFVSVAGVAKRWDKGY